MTNSTSATDFRVIYIQSWQKYRILLHYTREMAYVSNKTHHSMRFQYVLVACKAIVLGVTII